MVCRVATVPAVYKAQAATVNVKVPKPNQSRMNPTVGDAVGPGLVTLKPNQASWLSSSKAVAITQVRALKNPQDEFEQPSDHVESRSYKHTNTHTHTPM